MSWSELQGLYLFIDGRIVAQTKVSSPQNQVPISRISPNLVFGASLARTGFSKFYLATFTTFNTFLSQSAMRAVYTFYWRIGKFSLFFSSSSVSKQGFFFFVFFKCSTKCNNLNLANWKKSPNVSCSKLEEHPRGQTTVETVKIDLFPLTTL